MKILYAIQGTGNGHIARAFEVIPELQKHGEVDLLLSGNQCDLKLPWNVTYRLRGLSFIFGKKGGVDILATLKNIRFKKLMREISQLPVEKYDLVLNDFEPISAWACKLRNVPCIGISHQSAVLHPKAPKPQNKDLIGLLALKYYAPVSNAYGFHFLQLDKNISTPVIRSDVRSAPMINNNHYTVYLPAYADLPIINFLRQFPDEQFNIFSKHSNIPYSTNNIHVFPVNKEKFTESMCSGKGVFCTAGFETPAETLFLCKKLCVIPMKNQYEQQCNAAMLKSMHVTVLNGLTTANKVTFGQWLHSKASVPVHYPNITARLIDRIVCKHTHQPQDLPQFSLGGSFF
ncbi:glycosyl transferase [Marinilabiliaceae bacterium JC017]|nr:glycosyl transferase [Marinilabiliaceae bacterium JC017]